MHGQQNIKNRILVKSKQRHDAQNKAFKLHGNLYKTRNTITMVYTHAIISSHKIQTI
jgi:hypothetical protein